VSPDWTDDRWDSGGESRCWMRWYLVFLRCDRALCMLYDDVLCCEDNPSTGCGVCCLGSVGGDRSTIDSFRCEDECILETEW
jgi:hypothetical protein